MHRTQGIIVSSEKVGEADQRISLLSRDFGKVMCVARGSLKPDSKMRPLVQVGHTIDCILLPLRSGRYRLASPYLLEGYARIRACPPALSLFLASCSLIDAIVYEGSADALLWNFCIEWRASLERCAGTAGMRYDRAYTWFLKKLLAVLGGGAGVDPVPPLGVWCAGIDEISLPELRRSYEKTLGFSVPPLFLIQ